MFLLVLCFFVLNLGCMEGQAEKVAANGGGTKEIYGVLNGDADEDFWGDGNGSLQAHAEQICKDASSEGKSECVATMVAALKGSGDCDFVVADDPTVCFDGGLDCADEKYSVCAPCINPGAIEVFDGVDNDCDKQLLPGECDNKKVCDDENACTENDACMDGACEGAPLDCNDNNPCTDDSCDPAFGCVNENNDASCDDSNECTDTDTCANGVCVGLVLDCDDANECTDDLCEPFVGCHYSNNNAPCDDGDACTDNDTCVSGACLPGVSLDCDDTDACTDDSCDPMFGCVHTDVDCDDGDACTTETCDSAIGCVQGFAVECNDFNLCTTDSCVPATGCVYAAAFCDDGDACTDDSCDPQTGLCVYAPVVCNDGDLCNGVETCDPTTGCVAGEPLVCDDENPCTDDPCDKLAGCQYVANNNPCDDENACTENDVCADGVCVPGAPLDCDDGDDCTTDSCDPIIGCQHVLIEDCCQEDADCAPPPAGFVSVPGETFWSDGTYSFGCLPSTDPLVTNGVCLKCEDADADGYCDAFEGICNDGVDGDADGDTDCVDPDCGGKACTDGDACTNGDTCANSACVPGPALSCADADLCTLDTCDPALGCQHPPVNCNDKNLCTTDSCVSATGCIFTAVDCDDGDPCTTDSCDPATGCAYAAVPACCAVNDDCAGASEVCWQNECVTLSGVCMPFGVEATTATSYEWWGLAGKVAAGTATGPGTVDEAPSGACSVTVSLGGAVPAFCTCHYPEGVTASCCGLPGGGWGCVHNGDCF
ncbi:MAG: hypothetical protein HY569_01555 [Candidatus Magasanikbacteria bacterium]|nr:hypothetical protein [Candidatus Magasanikbacteria bacterium]